MQVGLIADVHGNALALQAVLRAMADQQVEHILVAGDLIGYYPQMNEVVELIRSQQTTTILGNHECYLLGKIAVSQKRWRDYRLDHAKKTITAENMAWLLTKPVQCRFEMEGLRFCLCHGSPWSVEEYCYPESKTLEQFAQLDADVVVLGHTHIPMVRQVGPVTVVNPGSCGQPRDYQPGACYAVLDIVQKKIQLQRISYDLACMVEMLQSLDYPEALIKILLRKERRNNPCRRK
jgi:putative phosphoesterase